VQTERHYISALFALGLWFGLDPPTHLLMLRGESTTDVYADAEGEVDICANFAPNSSGSSNFALRLRELR
jgi:hypothetical protein